MFNVQCRQKYFFNINFCDRIVHVICKESVFTKAVQPSFVEVNKLIKMNSFEKSDKFVKGESSDQNGDVLLNIFHISNKRYRVLLHFDKIVWENPKKQNTTIPLSDILAVKTAEDSSTNSICSDDSAQYNSSDKQKQYIRIFYAKRVENSRSDCNRWKKYSVTLYNSDSATIKLWYDTLNSILEKQNRPKSILLFINPYGGRKQALNIYEKHSKPLLQLANIEINCVISQRANQIRDIIMTQSLDQYDAVCCIGGDGTFAEVFNGLIFRAIHDLSLDPVQPEYIPKPKLPIGVIPAGSTDTMAFSLHGTTDIRTAVIHIILGQTRGLDVCSVCNSNGLLRLYASIVSYGYLGDIALDSEKYRWMGPKRYDYSGFKKIIANKGYEGEIVLLKSEDGEDGICSSSATTSSSSTIPSSTKSEDSRCYENCDRCSSVQSKISEEFLSSKSTIDGDRMDYVLMTPSIQNNNKFLENIDQEWKIVKGKFFMISGANVSCACPKAPNGFAPNSHLGDGFIDVILVRRTNVINNIRLLLCLAKTNSNIRRLPFVETHRTRKFYFRAPKTSCDDSINGSCQPISCSNNKTSHWNCDGEIIHDPDILIKSHCQLVNVFMRGPYEPSNIQKSCGSCFP